MTDTTTVGSRPEQPDVPTRPLTYDTIHKAIRQVTEAAFPTPRGADALPLGEVERVLASWVVDLVWALGADAEADRLDVVKQRDAARAEVDRLRADNQRLRDGIEQVAVELDRSADTADQAGALRDLLAGGDKTLWAIHHRGSDEYHAQPSRAEAERMKAWLDGYDAAQHGDPHAAFHRALVIEWPLSAEQHAAQLAEAVAR